MLSHVRALSFALSLGGLIGLGHSVSAATIVSQPPCTGASGFCVQFDASALPVTVRFIVFNAPGAGNAAVSFHGSLVCSNLSITDKVVDFATQIVTNAAAVPAVDGPGGMRVASVLKDASTHIFNTTDTINLASTRVVKIAGAGKRRFYFKIGGLRMDASTTCIVHNAVLTVLFLP